MARSGLLAQSNTASGTFVVDVDASLLFALEDRHFGQPLALGTAIREAVGGMELLPLQDFTKAQTSIYKKSTWSDVPWQVAAWALQTLGVTGRASGGEDKLPKGRYVIVENLETASVQFREKTAATPSRLDRTFTKAHFQNTFASELVTGQRISEADLDILLRFLSRDKGLIEYDGRTVRVRGAGEQEEEEGISEVDRAIASTKELMENLQHQADLLNGRIEQLSQSAKDAVARKNRVTALAALKSKKLAEASLATRYATLAQLEEVSAKIEQASDNVQLVHVMQSSSEALTSLNKQVGGADRIDDVMDSLREQMGAADEVAAILAESTGQTVVDEGEVDEELAAMERVEKEKEDRLEENRREEREEREAEEARMKLDALPDVPSQEMQREEKETTPTTETGIANLSMG